MIFADDGDDGSGDIFLMKFESESGRDGVEVAIGPGFVATLENITLMPSDLAMETKTTNRVLLLERIESMILLIASIARKKARKQNW